MQTRIRLNSNSDSGLALGGHYVQAGPRLGQGGQLCRLPAEAKGMHQSAIQRTAVLKSEANVSWPDEERPRPHKR